MSQALTPVEAFVGHVEKNPEKVYLKQPQPDGSIQEFTFAEVYTEVCRIADWLQQFPQGSRVGILSLNCAHWIMADLAIMFAGHVGVPIYPTASSTTMNQILEHADCRCLFLGKMPPEKNNVQVLNHEITVVSMFTHRGQHYNWDDLQPEDDFPDRPSVFPQLDTLASIIYTSGTTGIPKGVMISYRGMAEAGAILMDWIEIKEDDRFFSYLPLAHTAERTAIAMSSIFCGCEVSFVGSLDTFNEDLVRARPTVFFGVPRIWLKFQQAVESKLPGWLLGSILKVPVLGDKFAQSLREKLGLDQVKIAVSGAAALPLETINWFDAIGIPICEAYGMTESLGCATFNHPSKRQLGSVGRPVPGTIVKISDDNEIIYKNTCLMDGYYREPELTSQTVKDGYLYTGDTGYIDDEGFLWITGRIKDIFKTEKGKYIAPVPIESELEPRAALEQVCVLGSNLTQPVALSPIAAKPQGAELKALEEKLLRIMGEVNQHLSPNEKLACWFMVESVWSTDNGMITPTLKLRRQDIETAYLPQIMAYNDIRDQVIWLQEADTQ